MESALSLNHQVAVAAVNTGQVEHVKRKSQENSKAVQDY